MPPDQRGDPIAQDIHQLVHCAAHPNVMWCQHHGGISHVLGLAFLDAQSDLRSSANVIVRDSRIGQRQDRLVETRLTVGSHRRPDQVASKERIEAAPAGFADAMASPAYPLDRRRDGRRRRHQQHLVESAYIDPQLE